MRTPVLLTVLLALGSACAPLSHIRQLRESQVTAQLSLSDDRDIPQIEVNTPVQRDTLVVEDPEGNRMILMRAVKDQDGEMVAHEVLEAARVTARFRNVAERGGKVDLRFQIHVPSKMQDSKWQVRLYPDLFVLEDSVRLEPVLITGAEYRKAQLRGYQQYRRFLESISADSLHFVNAFQLENFLRRNLPQIYRFRTDSSYVSDEAFESAFGVTERQALEHYTNQLVVKRNLRKIRQKDQMMAKYVKSPIISQGLRLDSVIVKADGDICYEYVQTLMVRKGMRKASVVLSGAVFQEDKAVYVIPPAEPLTFYISSLSGLTENSVKYKTMVIERKVSANTACYIEFGQGSDVVDRRLSHNAQEMDRIKSNLYSLLENKLYDLDSIVVSASCSPEGGWKSNEKLSERRSKSVCRYFSRVISDWRDSVRRAEGIRLSLGEDYSPESRPITFIPRSDAENWRMLDALVQGDGNIGPGEKEKYSRLSSETDLDKRESAMHSMPSYRYMREALYPRLRVVKFGFHLTRKGVQKDTVHTTVVDSVYMDGLAAMRDRDYEKAVLLLGPYRDYNAAVAHMALDHNASAMNILATLEDTDNVLYLKALVYSRTGNESKAVECYLKACRINPSMVHRGNLDPEISGLINKYNIKNENY